ncbi:Ig-like domain-containing protein [Streptomyces sp. NPDC091387]|uniref:Ig-like domain-containing protein n=1 Tax=Streptomyces sp. NPDC091387 TaxID=3365998 RepID=UPI0037F9DB8B
MRAVPSAAPYSTSLFFYRGSSGVLIKDNTFDNGLNLRADLSSTDAAQVSTDEVTKDGTDRILPLVPSVTYVSGDRHVATVDRNGKVTARAAGTVTITPVTSSRFGDTRGTPVTRDVGKHDCGTPATTAAVGNGSRAAGPASAPARATP